jgi:hypothetical protein
MYVYIESRSLVTKPTIGHDPDPFSSTVDPHNITAYDLALCGHPIAFSAFQVDGSLTRIVYEVMFYST